MVKESELVSLGYRWKVTTNPKERKICRLGGPRESPPQILCRTYRDRLPSLLKISPTTPLSLFFGHRVNVGPQAPVARACASSAASVEKTGFPGKNSVASVGAQHSTVSVNQQLLEDVPVDTSTRANRKQPKEQDTMVATRKSKVLPEPVSATDSADADSEETQNFNYERKQGSRGFDWGRARTSKTSEYGPYVSL